MEPSLRSFDQESINDSDQIALYSKLIDVIDKDVESIRSQNSREGVTIWGIIGGIVTGVAFFLSKTSQLDALPPMTIETACVSLIFLYLVWGIYNVRSGGGSMPKPGRLISTNKFLSGRVIWLLLRATVLLVFSFFLLNTSFINWSRWLTIALVFVPLLIIGASTLAMWLNKLPFGNNPRSRPFTIFALILSLLCYLIPSVLLGSQLSFPVGKEPSDAFSIGIAISLVIVLFEMLLTLASDTSNTTAYLDLRDDIILRDISLDDALLRYRIIREGMSSWDQLKSDFEEIIKHVNHTISIFDEQLGIIEKQKTATEADFGSLSKSFMVHMETLKNEDQRLSQQYSRFDKKRRRTFAATGDRATDEFILNALNSALQLLQSKQNETYQANAAMFQERSTKLGTDKSASSNNTERAPKLAG